MAALKEILPPAKSSATTFYDHSSDPWFKQRYSAPKEEEEAAAVVKSSKSPLYNTAERLKYRPSKAEHYGDGGAFPEIHYAQYPLDMGRKKDTSGPKTLPVTVDSHGNLTFDAIVKQNENAKKIVYSQRRDLVPKVLKDEEEEDDEKQKEIEDTTQQTKAALEKIVNVRLSAAQPKNVQTQSQDSKFIKYKPSQQSAAFNSGANERIIRMVEMPVDPLEPPKFKHKRVPKANGSPPVPVMHSPPRPVTVKDQQDWKIPPCISNWKNPKGYTIPLDKRLAADGRGLQEVQINDNFAKLSESLYLAEQKAREAVAMRSKVQKEMMMKEKEKKELELRALAQKARFERTGAGAPIGNGSFVPSDKDMMDTDEPVEREQEPRRVRDRDQPRESKEEREERNKREKIREERRRERERERRLEAKDAAMGKKSKLTRDRDRDVSEKVALGMASAGASHGGEVQYDQRLFNQDKGMDSGFGTDDQYNVYTNGLFTAQPTLSTLYRPKKDADDEMYGGADEQLEKIRKTDRFKPDKGFSGAGEKSGLRSGPVEFEKDAGEEADPFGLDQFITEVKGGKKPLDKVGSGGTMRASGGSSTREGYEGSGRSRIGFQKGR
uniref:SNW/SKI-interacting protein A-like n=1 Tax=Erigeron canadensis TaxID=72917 RepID=UPI001CB8EBC6|nr:SNW/SKI-interacting protein A-like [Erigeron canadensis]XP_043623322.1 SNW/SKI-interacting protein A-like [Erigeron canadensis]XP_043623323.1 SNW/SKI-interacting protein A-like [Erigeron canadensis]XP_043623324.1 SNW/SKI-interacting protein A-like [Erigeron canadensis]XP_043623325.1 SNW/SKI-interacting protein A-like [Erigeron canadensis]XP_043623326.1 SNW/SKI-interacting protein A-like [Erigeron canadensis]